MYKNMSIKHFYSVYNVLFQSKAIVIKNYSNLKKKKDPKSKVYVTLQWKTMTKKIIAKFSGNFVLKLKK